jgi:tetratricopeptide (TPR) repeat protein
VRWAGRLSAAALCACFLIGLSGCAGVQTRQVLADRGALPARAEITSVPFFAQEKYYCGPAALATALAWSGLAIRPDDLVSQVYTPEREGTFAADMVSAARRNGRLAVEINALDAVLRELAAGHPVVVFQNLSLAIYPQWHFAVAVGYDLIERQIILRSGTHQRLLVPLDAFENTWRRANYWALVVLPPDRTPVAADMTHWLDAAAGLERAARPEEAQLAYENFLTRWPGNRAAQMGRANALYAESRFENAEQAYRTLLDGDPLMAEAWNNLAYALRRQGRREEAVRAAERAVSIAGTNLEYADTLKDVAR